MSENCQHALKSTFLYSWVTDCWSPHEVSVDMPIATSLAANLLTSSTPISVPKPSKASPALKCADVLQHHDFDVKDLVNKVIEDVYSAYRMHDNQLCIRSLSNDRARYNVKSYDEKMVLDGDYEDDMDAEDSIEGVTKDDANPEEVINNKTTQEPHA